MTSRLFIQDKVANLKFLIDSGLEISVLPPTAADRSNPSVRVLHAANGSKITTYGNKTIVLSLNLPRKFKWKFTVANVTHPIIGADLLLHQGLLLDFKDRKLIDRSQHCTSVAVADLPSLGLSAVNKQSPFWDLLSSYTDLISDEPMTKAQVKHDTEHFIETKGPPVTACARRLSPEKLAAAKADFEALQKLGLIRPSRSNYASPIHMVRKKNGSWRICGDYRRLNAVTTPDRYPIPHLQDCNHMLFGKKIFSSVDLRRAYQQIPVHKDDIPKTAVITPFGLFECPFMPFGLCGAAATFQRFIHEVTRGLDFIYVFLDDILIASADEEQHLQHLKILFDRLQQYGLKVNSEKCVLGVDRLLFLGHDVSAEGLSPNPERVAPIVNYPIPKTTSDLRRFLGMVNFYNRFIPKAAELQIELQTVIAGRPKKDKTPLQWTPELDSAFSALKTALSQATVLAHPSLDAPLSVSTDASDVAIGGVVHQHVNGKKQPLGFFSRKLQPSQLKYSTYDRELLAIHETIKHFRYLLEARDFVVYTDHRPLTYAFQQQSDRTSPTQARQLAFISQFTTRIEHLPGDQNVVADALSRIASITLPSKIDFDRMAQLQDNDEDLPNLLKNSSLKLVQTVPVGGSSSLYCDVSNGFVRPYVPKSMRREIFDALHNQVHPGVRSTVRLVTQRYVWPDVKRDCTAWARSCVSCQRAKVGRHIVSPLAPIQLPSTRFEHVHIDIVGPLPVSEGNHYILTCIDRFSRWPEAFPMPDMTAETVAKTFLHNWISRFGVPLRLSSDQGRQFESRLFKELCSLLGTHHLRTTPYHPQSNGLIERWHRTLKATLKCFPSNKWTSVLPLTLLGLRSALKEDIGASPAEMVYGQTLRLPADFVANSAALPVDANAFIVQLKEHMQKLRPTQTTHHGEPKVFVPAQLAEASHVFVRTDAVRTPLQPPYQGPFAVLKRSDKTFTVQMAGRKSTISIDRLKPAFFSPSELSSLPVPTTTKDPNPTSVSATPPAAQTSRRVTRSSTRSSAPSTTPPKGILRSSPRTTQHGRRVHFPRRIAEYAR
ncbi:Reverse transcriptase (RNA-dependent DNA polymerase) [Nesidiocoris tenuis]|uniref:RNA-directed DNA polymerase n=1 Tax=Nesidiocoris tenuis TaxID=355587 RepID=A0ABN7APM6_9HEMI|nr:Reverse transcriptase (RNA-dependent DNA polymerase) [Nesidiocoris tenuis]